MKKVVFPTNGRVPARFRLLYLQYKKQLCTYFERDKKLKRKVREESVNAKKSVCRMRRCALYVRAERKASEPAAHLKQNKTNFKSVLRGGMNL